ncbi:MAG: hypothetical protein KGJ13_06435 [Patescibacteria group bacterium]|nr:hypothetical protein [Patescibacteria group bacterium]
MRSKRHEKSVHRRRKLTVNRRRNTLGKAEHDIVRRQNALYSKWVHGRATKQDRMELVSCGRLTSGQAGLNGEIKKENSESESCSSQRKLAARLTQIFEGRLVSIISQTQICSWLNGDVPAGTPLPPQPINNHYDVKAWSEWTEKYLVPLPGWGLGQIKTNVHEVDLSRLRFEKQQLASIAKAEDEILRAHVNAGKYKPVELYNRHIASFFAEANGYIAEGERLMEKSLREKLGPLMVNESFKFSIESGIREGVRTAADNFRAGLKRSLELHTETESVEQK